jgi:spore maturation protein CgeB
MMRVVYFTHSLRSCWNHGNAHFLRGVLRELQALGHDVIAFEPDQNWSFTNLLQDAGPDAADLFRARFPTLRPRTYDEAPDLDAMLDGADLIIVHEWNDPALVAAIGRHRGHATLLFHDTHHRAVSDPDAMRRFDLSRYDGILAFGETLAAIYRKWDPRANIFVWHEAADTRHFHPPQHDVEREGAVWVGNWGDGERTAEIEDFLLAPARQAVLKLDIYGVRYPAQALALLDRYGASYQGWAPNAAVPEIFARAQMTVHVPRRYYAAQLPGIPTIRVFEALACGIPLISAPWQDSENLFTPGQDFLVAANRQEMEAHMRNLRHDPAMAAALAEHGLRTIQARHTCAHRARELLHIADQLTSRKAA